MKWYYCKVKCCIITTLLPTTLNPQATFANFLLAAIIKQFLIQSVYGVDVRWWKKSWNSFQHLWVGYCFELGSLRSYMSCMKLYGSHLRWLPEEVHRVPQLGSCGRASDRWLQIWSQPGQRTHPCQGNRPGGEFLSNTQHITQFTWWLRSGRLEARWSNGNVTNWSLYLRFDFRISVVSLRHFGWQRLLKYKPRTRASIQ